MQAWPLQAAPPGAGCRPDPLGACCCVQLMVHAADISHPARPLALCRRWGLKVHEEMFAQGERMGMRAPLRLLDAGSLAVFH